MNSKGKEINVGDIIFAKLVQQGRELLSLTFTGVRSIADIVAYMRGRADGTVGPVVMKIRNYSQGWSMESGLMMRPAMGCTGQYYRSQVSRWPA